MINPWNEQGKTIFLPRSRQRKHNQSITIFARGDNWLSVLKKVSFSSAFYFVFDLFTAAGGADLDVFIGQPFQREKNIG